MSRKILSKVQKVRAIASYQRKYESLLNRTENLANKLFTAFENPVAKFSPDQVKKIYANLDTVANKLASGLKGCFTNLRAAIATELPSNTIVAHVEDAHTLLSKIAILRAQAIASITAEEDIQMDESGQLVEDTPMEDSEDLETEEPLEEEEEERSPEEIVQDVQEDLNLLAQELGGEISDELLEGEELDEGMTASKKASDSGTIGNPNNPDTPKENPKIKEPKDVLKLQDEYEKAPLGKNAKKKSAENLEKTFGNPSNPDSPEENPESEEESLEELVGEFEKSPSDPENLEMEDSMIDDVVNIEILCDGDMDVMEDEVIKSSASLKEKKLISSKRTASSEPVSEDAILGKLISESMF